MRLINCSTFEQQQLHDIGGLVDYAILSHRWLDRGELTFKDYYAKRIVDGENSPALDKILGACRAARERDIEWIWIDNVCIDKSSSSELSESINSMFNWYRQAKLCIVYLADTDGSIWKKQDGKEVASEWFSRGWTLQELLAPRQMEFYDRGWRAFGSKSQLAQVIADASRIEVSYLNGQKHFRKASIATRLSWQAPRTTTREEDMSYSLLGVLGVSLDPRYGEGGYQAFVRLQEELIRNQTVSDESLFAWTMPVAGLPSHDRDGWESEEWGLLAPSPKCFLHSGDITAEKQFRARRDNGIAKTGDGVVFPMTLRELQSTSRLLTPLHFIVPFSTVAINYVVHKRRKEFAISLNCWRVDPSTGKDRPIQIAICRDQKGDQYWRRCHCDQLGLDMKMSTSHLNRVSKPVTILQPNILD